MRLTDVMSDLLSEVNHLCKENGMEMTDGMDALLEEAQGLLAKLKATQTLPLSKLLRRPRSVLGHPLESPEDGTEPRDRQDC